MPRKKVTPAEEKRLERRVEVAVLTGAGKTQVQIGRELGVSQQAVSVHQKMIKQDPVLLEAVEQAKRDITDRMVGVLARHVDTLDEALKIASPKEVPGLIREAREIVWPKNMFEKPAAVGAPQINISTENPAVMASFVEALRMLNEGKAIEVAGERVEDSVP